MVPEMAGNNRTFSRVNQKFFQSLCLSRAFRFADFRREWTRGPATPIKFDAGIRYQNRRRVSLIICTAAGCTTPGGRLAPARWAPCACCMFVAVAACRHAADPWQPRTAATPLPWTAAAKRFAGAHRTDMFSCVPACRSFNPLACRTCSA